MDLFMDDGRLRIAEWAVGLFAVALVHSVGHFRGKQEGETAGWRRTAEEWIPKYKAEKDRADAAERRVAELERALAEATR